MIGYINYVNIREVVAQNTKNHLIDSAPVPSCTSTKYSSQEITKSDVRYSLHHTGKSPKLDFVHRKDFILLVIILFFHKKLELNYVEHSICFQTFFVQAFKIVIDS